MQEYICLFDTTKVIEDPSDLEGWQEVEQEDREGILKLIRENVRTSPTKTPESKAAKKKVNKTPKENKQQQSTSTASQSSTGKFPEMRKLVFRLYLIISGASQEASVTSISKRDSINPGHKVIILYPV